MKRLAKGIVLFTTNDHTFMQSVANRIIVITPAGIIDRLMSFDEYLADERIKTLRAEMLAEPCRFRQLLLPSPARGPLLLQFFGTLNCQTSLFAAPLHSSALATLAA